MKRKLHFLLAVGIGLMASVGWLHAEERNVSTFEELKEAISQAKNGDQINLTVDINVGEVASGSAITIDKGITLNGRIDIDAQSYRTCNIYGSAIQNIIAVTGTGAVTIKDISIMNQLPDGVTPEAGKGYNDITVYQRGSDEANKVTLKGVSLIGNGGIGLVVQGSNVDLEGIGVLNHVWGSVNLEKANNVAPSLKLEYCDLAGPAQIYVDSGKEKDASWVKTSSYVYKENLGLWTDKLGDKSYRVTTDFELYSLVSLINSATPVTGIDTLLLAPYEFYLSSQLVITKPIVLKGTSDGTWKTVLKANSYISWPTKKDATGNDVIDNSKANLISIEGNATGKVGLQDLTIEGSMAAGINAQSALETTLKNVILKDNATAGLLVHSKVTAENLQTSGNTWGGVNVDNGSPTYNTLSFSFDAASNFAENTKIWSEVMTGDIVTFPTNANWRFYSGSGSDHKTSMRYWTNSKLSFDYDLDDAISVYANGNPITITSSSTEGMVKIAVDGAKDSIELAETANPIVFGGSKNADVGTSKITMNSGSILDLFGGGYGAGNKTSGTQANVTNKTTIKINGGTIRNILVGGGHYYSKSPEVDMTISGGRIATLYAGGYDAGKTTNTLESTWENCVNGVKTFKLTMTGGTITEGLGCGGGQGYAHTDSSYVKISDATLAAFYGVLSNGSARTIKAELDNCTFSAIGEYYEFASVNRGKAGKIDFTFDACSFNNLDKIYANLGAVDGWASSDTDGKIVPAVTDSVKFTFTNSKTSTPVMKVGQGLGETDIELTGAVAKIDSALVSDKDGKKQWHNEFTLGEGKTWTLNDGLTMASGVTLTKTGTLKYAKSFEANVKTLAEMQNALTLVNAGDGSVPSTINMEDNMAVPNDNVDWMADFKNLEYYFQIKKPVTINGNKKSISGNFPEDDGTKKKYVITADYTGNEAITINDLTIENTNATALNITWPKNVILNNVTLNNNEAGGLNINSAKVKATNLQTSGNRAGVRIQHQDATSGTTPYFELVSGTLKDSVQIAFHNRTVTDNEEGVAITDYDALVTLPENDKYIKTWRKAELKAGKEAIVRVWANSRFANEYISSTKTIQLDSISSGLDSLLIDQTFATVAGVMNTSVKYSTFNKDFTASALRDSLIINCEDAYLVTGEKEAAAFAEVAKNKPVKQLTLANNRLAVVSAISTPIIEDERSWNDATYAQQNVIIKDGGILNINTAMALDTVFMEEGAQLKVLPNTAVTANAVQLAYKVTGNWKAFGFPFNTMGDNKTMIVRDASGETTNGKAVQTTADGEFGKDENGFWTAKTKTSAIGFDLTTTVATPDSACLIAASREGGKDSMIYVTSPASVVIPLGTKEAPAAPTTTTPSLSMFANPNLFAMQLQGYAYILDESNVFVQQFNPTVAPFKSYILADATTTSSLRSLRVGETPTGNEVITPVEGYFVEAGRGMITIRTAEPLQVVVVDMLGRVYYNARVTSDGYQINLPAGIYAVNNQKVIVK